MTSYIDITNLTVRACHGCHDFEKTTPQPFVFSARLFCDVAAAAKDDALADTVSYSDVMKLLSRHALTHTYNLIETLADRAARELLRAFPAVRAASLTVQKPEAPVKLDFESVSVTVELGWEEAVVALGSNLGEREKYLDFAVDCLEKDENIRVKRVSSYYKTPPYGGVATEEFCNGAVLLETLYTPRELLAALQRIEREGGRVRKERWGNRTLDLDLVFFGRRVIAEEGLIVPHPECAKRRFVLEPVAEIAPWYYSPVHGATVKELLEKIS